MDTAVVPYERNKRSIQQLKNPQYKASTSQHAPEVVPRPPAVGAAPSSDGRVFSDLASSCMVYAAFVAAAISMASLLAQSDTRSNHLGNSESGPWTTRPCFVDAFYCLTRCLFQQASRNRMFISVNNVLFSFRLPESKKKKINPTQPNNPTYPIYVTIS